MIVQNKERVNQINLFVVVIVVYTIDAKMNVNNVFEWKFCGIV